MTNRDYLNSLNDEQFAKALFNGAEQTIMTACHYGLKQKGNDSSCQDYSNGCKECIQNWLKAEREEQNNDYEEGELP